MKRSESALMSESGYVPKGMIVIATLLVVTSLVLFYSVVTNDGTLDSWATSLDTHPIATILKAIVIVAGFVTARGLWKARRWAFWSYLIWFAMYISLMTFLDREIEPVAWKLIAGLLMRAILPGYCALYLFYARRRTSVVSAPLAHLNG